VERLPPYAKVACLSNTNVLDVRRFRDELNPPARFDACFFSNEIGYRKPNADSYLHVLGAFGLTASPGRALFLDDSTACVEGARQVGMQAYRVCGIREVSSCLAALGIRSSDDPRLGV
jgi:putative hydrolase of the HAD superfamily